MLPLHIVVGSIKSVIAISDGPHALARLLLWRAGFLLLTLTLLRGIQRHGGFRSPIGPFLIGERSRSGREAGVAHLSNIWVLRAHVAATVVGTHKRAMDGTCHCEALVGRTGHGNVCPGADLAELFDVVAQLVQVVNRSAGQYLLRYTFQIHTQERDEGHDEEDGLGVTVWREYKEKCAYKNEINGGGANDKTGYPRVRNESIIFALTRSGGRVLR